MFRSNAAYNYKDFMFRKRLSKLMNSCSKRVYKEQRFQLMQVSLDPALNLETSTSLGLHHIKN